MKKKMAKKRISEVAISPSHKKQKYLVHKNPLQRVIRKKTSETKFFLRLKRFLIQRNQNLKIKKRNSSGIGTVSSVNKSRISASSDCSRKCKSPDNSPPSPVSSPPVLLIQASSNGKRKLKTPAKCPPVLPIQVSSNDSRKNKSPVKNPPVLLIQASSDCIRKRKIPAKRSPVLAIQASGEDNRELESPAKSPSVFSIEDQSSQAWEQDEHDLPEVTSLASSSTCPAPHMNGKMKILRESNAVSPATVMPAPSCTENVRVGFDRNLEPQKIVKMAELRGKDYFIMKWKGSEIMDIVPTEIAKERCPQVVIAFYEKHLTNVHNRAMDSYE